MIAERVQNFLGCSFCLHVTQCFDYPLSNHNTIVRLSVVAFTSASMLASVSFFASMYKSCSVLPRNTAAPSKSVFYSATSVAFQTFVY